MRGISRRHWARPTTIRFDCGALPITMTLSSTSAIARALTIDGNNKVTLDMGGAAKHFQVAAGGNLNLKNITLAHGNNTGLSCGGAIGVEAGGQVTLDTVRLIENHSNQSRRRPVQLRHRQHLGHALPGQQHELAWRGNRELRPGYDQPQPLRRQPLQC